jgi:hypothetical protein
MNGKYKTIGYSDDVIISNLKKYFEVIEQQSIPVFSANILNVSTNLSITSDVPKATNILSLSVQFPMERCKNVPLSISISRVETILQISFAADQNQVNQIGIIPASDYINKLKNIFKEINELEYIKKYSPDLAQLYQERENALGKIEETSIRITESYEQFRRKASEDLIVKQNELEDSFRKKTEALQDDFQIRKNELEAREKKLDELKKSIDDRNNTHVRREISQQLLHTLKQRYTSFSLSNTTIKKRIIIHVLFSFFILTLAVALGMLLYTNTHDTLSYIKIGISTFGFAATILYYIKWNDSWFRKHAEEEFYMKRFELDIERASWLVEMVMEFQNEKGGDIPNELIKTLSTNLFSNKTFEKINHPSEEIIDGLLKGLSGITIGLPNGNVEFGGKAAKGIRKAIKSAEA